jgi:serine/threonine-protein kinase HipA
MTARASLTVLMNGELAGVLVQNGASHRFEYDRRYQQRLGSTPLSIGLPLIRTVHSGTAVTNFLWGFLPDNERVLERWGVQFDVSPRNPFALLAHVGEDCAGALQFVRDERTGQLVPGTIEWLDEADLAARIRAIRNDSASWLPSQGATGYHSLAGAQPKFAVARDGDRWGIPGGERPTTHIIKPNLSPFDDFDLNEHLCLRAANTLGLRAAHSEIFEFDGERALVVERFDRISNTNIRVHQEDMCQALGLHPFRKYQSDKGPSVAGIAAAIHENATGPDHADIDAFVDALAFSWLTVGTDAHAKNYSFLLSGAQVRLAPLYDVSSALPYQLASPGKPKPGELFASGLRLAMKIGGIYEADEINADNWRRAADDLRLSPDAVVSRVSHLAAHLAEAFARAAAESPLVSNSATVQTTVERIARRATRCQRALT